MNTCQKRFPKYHCGATMVEYGLILALISIAVIATVTAIGLQIDENFQEICLVLNHGEACDIE